MTGIKTIENKLKTSNGNYGDYARAALEDYARRDRNAKSLFFDAVKNSKIETVLDLGCGAGQELFPFLESTNAFCVGIDKGAEIGAVTNEIFAAKNFSNRAGFVRASGEKIPFAGESFDVVLCSIALPYMNNRETIAEVARVLKTGGAFILKIHSPAFYFSMIAARLKTLSPKMLAYPLICLTAGAYHHLTKKQLERGFWEGKEVYQTRGILRRICAENGLRVIEELEKNNLQTPTFLIKK